MISYQQTLSKVNWDLLLFWFNFDAALKWHFSFWQSDFINASLLMLRCSENK